MRRLLQIVGLVCLTVATSSHLHAMTFGRVDLDAGYLVTLSGEIQTGDTARLGTFFAALPPGKLLGFGLNSPGGNLLEAERLATGMHTLHPLVIVSKVSMCASACFLLFAAGDKRLVGPGAAIGVHSASTGGTEGLDTLGMTTLFARDLSAYGVPPDIIGQLVITPADRMNWLTIEQLQEMGVKFSTPEPDAPSDPTPAQTFGAGVAPAQSQASDQRSTTVSTPVVPPAPVVASIPVQAPPAFTEGMNDRKAWETWVAGLTPSAHQGAEFWASQRSLPKPLACETQVSKDKDWKFACSAARTWFVRSDFRRYHEPVYRAGWNAE